MDCFSPYDDPFLYRNRDKSQDNFYKRQPYYGVGGIEKLPNRIVALFCILIAGFGLFLQILAIRFVAKQGLSKFCFHFLV